VLVGHYFESSAVITHCVLSLCVVHCRRASCAVVVQHPTSSFCVVSRCREPLAMIVHHGSWSCIVRRRHPLSTVVVHRPPSLCIAAVIGIEFRFSIKWCRSSCEVNRDRISREEYTAAFGFGFGFGAGFSGSKSTSIASRGLEGRVRRASRRQGADVRTRAESERAR
jgi:hypothetical protein